MIGETWGAPPHNHELEETGGGIATQPHVFDEMWGAPPHNHKFEDEEMWGGIATQPHVFEETWGALPHNQLPVAKTARRQKTAHGAPSEPQHTTIKERKKALTILPCLTGPYAPAAYFLSTMRTLPTKLAGNLTHTPINTPIKAIRMILIIFSTFITFLHHSNFYFCVHHCCSISLLSPKP